MVNIKHYDWLLHVSQAFVGLVALVARANIVTFFEILQVLSKKIKKNIVLLPTYNLILEMPTMFLRIICPHSGNIHRIFTYFAYL
jgi:hypothetical protein